MNSEERKPRDPRGQSGIRGNPDTSERAEEYEQDYQKVLTDLKFKINELCFEYFPCSATMGEMDNLTGEFFEKIMDLWDKYRPKESK
jgi:hypothetical protein